MNDVVQVNHAASGKPPAKSDDAQLDLFFKIHEKVNSRSEEISKSYNQNILVKFSDIKELHNKTIQSISALKPAKSAIGIRIVVSHNEGESEKFNSFEDFEKYNITSPNPTSDVMMTYSFTLYDGEAVSFENYKITNHIRSRVAQLKQIEREAPPFISNVILASMITDTAKITVQFGDYVKARHFTAMFDEWIKGCDESKTIKFINNLKPFSHLITRFGKLIIIALLAYFTSSGIDMNVIGNNFGMKFMVVYASFFVIVSSISELFLRKIEMSIDGYLPISYLDINKGDAKLIKEYEWKNSNAVIWTFVGFLGTFLIGLFTNSVYDIIKWFILK